MFMIMLLLSYPIAYHDIIYFKESFYGVDEIAQVFMFKESGCHWSSTGFSNLLLWFVELSCELVVLQ